jgi:carbamoyl-phosphate synthase small subunit
MKWNWKEQREKKAFLALEDGTVLRGHSVGAARDNLGEVVFNTGMTGYQEILSDPSYSGQFVTMTYPEIGNTGINEADMESRQFFAGGFIMHECNEASNWRSDQSLREALEVSSIPAIAGLDTRALTVRLREQGTLKGYLSVCGEVDEEAAVAKAREWCGLDGQDYAARVTCEEAYDWDPCGKLTCSWGVAEELPPLDLNIVAYDFGIKWNILRGLKRTGMQVRVVPAQTPAEEVLKLKPDGVFLSNGPADPAAVTYAVEAAKALLGKVPLMGICLGHQLLGLACGGTTYRMKFGHHGCNHPVKDLLTGDVEITSQNHNFAVDPESIDKGRVEITHINLNDMSVEGLRHKQEPMFSVQYHPEAGPGPHDPYYLFARFRELIKNS